MLSGQRFADALDRGRLYLLEDLRLSVRSNQTHSPYVITNQYPGWDPAFEYEGQTYAEMAKDEKNKISHRGKALEKLKAWLMENAD